MQQDQGVTPAGPGSQASPEAVPSSPSVSIPNAALIDYPVVLRIARALAGRGNALNAPDMSRFDRLGSGRRTEVLNDATAAWQVCEQEIAQRMKEAAAGYGLFGAQVTFDEEMIDALLAGAASGIEARSDETAQQAQPEGQEPGGKAETPTP